MFPLHPLFAVTIYVIAFATAYLIRKKSVWEAAGGRYECIDGLRGFLALGVFIHHCSIWYAYSKTGNWEAPKSNLYNQFGQTSVALFFMITGFLFMRKLFNSAAGTFDWKHFFVSRIYRLMPMYYVSVFLVFVCVGFASNWQLQVSIVSFLLSIVHWGMFTILRYPLINGYAFAHHVNAGVIWSLPYEWLFYFSLPAIAFIVQKKTPLHLLVISIAFMLLFYSEHGVIVYHLLSFVGGILAAVLMNYPSMQVFVKRKWVGTLVIAALAGIGQFQTANNIYCQLLIAVAFYCIAMGNTVFGLLRSATWQFLGEICYSTYLLHGILLFAVFYGGFGLDFIRRLNPSDYCLLCFCLTPIVVCVSYLGFRFIEKPFIDKAAKVRAQHD